jgi:hypothetical protein
VTVYLHQNHGRDLLRRESLRLSKVLNLNDGVSTLINDLEGPRLDILLDNGIIIPTSDETPRVC